jgi:glycosyltransferase involved in cell wall biosynthesis
MATVAFIQHRLGRTDGVSLEVDKWRTVLESHGHTVHYIAGNDDVPGGRCIPELYPFHPVTQRIIRNATRELSDYDNPAALIKDIEAHSARIKPQIEAFLDELGIELLLPNNLLSVGYNLPGMLALSRTIAERRVPTICHNHDFWWEDSGEVYPTCDEVIALYRQHAPPDYPWVQHVTINRIGQQALQSERGIVSTVVPNVFDFSVGGWELDDYNRDFREAVGVGPGDVMLLQATRILDRKAVELAIDVAAALNRPANRKRIAAAGLYDGRSFGSSDRVVLVCSGYVEEIGLTDSYPAALQRRADRQGVELVWAGECVGHSRGRTANGEKIYSLWDSYVQADIVTYPSVWEGWGNQFIEAVYARLPVVLFEYPVWRSDLAHAGFEVASLGAEISGHDPHGLVTIPEAALERAVDQVIVYLTDADARREATEHNFAVARERYSFEALADYVVPLVDRALGR